MSSRPRRVAASKPTFVYPSEPDSEPSELPSENSDEDYEDDVQGEDDALESEVDDARDVDSRPERARPRKRVKLGKSACNLNLPYMLFNQFTC
jgi:hypothetical protein